MPNIKRKSKVAPGIVVGVTQSSLMVEAHRTSNQRRKLIKASAAVLPAIMTLRSGAAAAMVSNDQCIADDAALAENLPDSKLVWGDSLDENILELDAWVRVPGRRIVVGNDILYGVPDSQGNYSTGQEWYDKNGNIYSGNVNQNKVDRGTDVYLLAYVDSEDGSYSWYPRIAPAGANPITGSCLCSVDPTMANLF